MGPIRSPLEPNRSREGPSRGALEPNRRALGPNRSTHLEYPIGVHYCAIEVQ